MQVLCSLVSCRPRAAIIIAILVSSVWPSLVIAAESADAGRASPVWGVGFGASNQQKPYAGIDRETTAVPVIQFENQHIRLLGPLLEYKLPGLDISASQRLDFSLGIVYDIGGGYEAGDARILRGMRERKGSVWGGAGMVWRTGLVNLSARWVADLSGYSDGQRVSIGLEKAWRVGTRMRVTPRLGLVWQDDKYVDYYFGVRPDEVRADRPAYAGESALNAQAGIQAIYMFDRRHSLLLDFSATRLATEIEDSPLVDRATENRVLFGYVFRF